MFIEIFNEILVRPILNLLLIFYKLFNIVGIPGAFGFSIILLTITVRFLLNPLTKKQLHSMKKLNDLKPEIDALSKKHGSDKKTLQQEQLKLYQRAGINPAAGCLPALVQIPIFIALYNVFLLVLGKNDLTTAIALMNKQIYPFFSFLKIDSIDLSFFGLNLATKPNQWQTLGWGLLLVPVITGLLQWIQTKMTMPQQVAKTQDKNQPKKEDDFQKALQTQTTFLLPLMIGFFAYSFPLGLALYWNTFSVFGIIQQKNINKKQP